VGVALAFAGVGVVVYGELGGGGGSSLKGDLLVVIATVCWGSHAVLSLPLLRTYSPLTVAAYTMLFGVSPPYPARRSGLLGGRVEPNKQRGVGGHGLFDAVGGGLWVLGLAVGVSRVGANRVLVYQCLITLVGVVSGVVLLGESVTINKILGEVVILLGVYLARRQW